MHLSGRTTFCLERRRGQEGHGMTCCLVAKPTDSVGLTSDILLPSMPLCLSSDIISPACIYLYICLFFYSLYSIGHYKYIQAASSPILLSYSIYLYYIYCRILIFTFCISIYSLPICERQRGGCRKGGFLKILLFVSYIFLMPSSIYASIFSLLSSTSKQPVSQYLLCLSFIYSTGSDVCLGSDMRHLSHLISTCRRDDR